MSKAARRERQRQLVEEYAEALRREERARQVRGENAMLAIDLQRLEEKLRYMLRRVQLAKLREEVRV